MLIFSVFFGRLFCGYVCAGAGFGEMAGCINEKAPKLGRLRYIKYVIWFLWLAIVTGLYIANGGLPFMKNIKLTSMLEDRLFIESYYCDSCKILITKLD
ncbi:hypothetical protein [Extibacter muris]|uniref:hypothetical protein n=1 Tax=Extibacter muris TaxID=1796622 RepID=UPI002108ED4F|nr:hypothetical protein [Extibacter muris]